MWSKRCPGRRTTTTIWTMSGTIGGVSHQSMLRISGLFGNGLRRRWLIWFSNSRNVSRLAGFWNSSQESGPLDFGREGKVEPCYQRSSYRLKSSDLRYHERNMYPIQA